MSLGAIRPRFFRLDVRDLPAAVVHAASPQTPRSHRAGSRRCLSCATRVLAVRTRRGSAITAGWPVIALVSCLERRHIPPGRRRVSVISGANAALMHSCIGSHGAETPRQIHQPDAALDERVAASAGTAARPRGGTCRWTASGRPPRTACRARVRPEPVVSLGIVGGQQQQDLGLQRVRILELVYEDVRVSRSASICGLRLCRGPYRATRISRSTEIEACPTGSSARRSVRRGSASRPGAKPRDRLRLGGETPPDRSRTTRRNSTRVSRRMPEA